MNKEGGLLSCGGTDISETTAALRYQGYELVFSTVTRELRLVVLLENNESSKSATFGDIGTKEKFCRCPQLYSNLYN
jgi:hypothetical protein